MKTLLTLCMAVAAGTIFANGQTQTVGKVIVGERQTSTDRQAGPAGRYTNPTESTSLFWIGNGTVWGDTLEYKPAFAQIKCGLFGVTIVKTTNGFSLTRSRGAWKSRLMTRSSSPANPASVFLATNGLNTAAGFEYIFLPSQAYGDAGDGKQLGEQKQMLSVNRRLCRETIEGIIAAQSRLFKQTSAAWEKWEDAVQRRERDYRRLVSEVREHEQNIENARRVADRQRVIENYERSIKQLREDKKKKEAELAAAISNLNGPIDYEDRRNYVVVVGGVAPFTGGPTPSPDQWRNWVRNQRSHKVAEIEADLKKIEAGSEYEAAQLERSRKDLEEMNKRANLSRAKLPEIRRAMEDAQRQSSEERERFGPCAGALVPVIDRLSAVCREGLRETIGTYDSINGRIGQQTALEGRPWSRDDRKKWESDCTKEYADIVAKSNRDMDGCSTGIVSALEKSPVWDRSDLQPVRQR